jgi:formylglycine-generating enzyme required for sulfatase activity
MHIVAKVLDLLAYSSPEKIAGIESSDSDQGKDRDNDQLNTETLYEIDANNKEYTDTRIDQFEVTTSTTGSLSGEDSKPDPGEIHPSVENGLGVETQIIEPAKRDPPDPRKRYKFLKILIPIGLLVIILVVAFFIANPYDSFWIREKGLLNQVTRTSSRDNMEMVYVPAGSFFMGSEKQYADSDESPVHEVYLDAFWIDKYEVSNAQYQACVEAGGCDSPDKGDLINSPFFQKHPVVYINWTNAKEYCKWVGRHLPSEAQWEKAARGIDQRSFPWGEGINCQFSRYDNCDEGTVTINSFSTGQSAYGAFNMAGNVAEWVNDYYTEDYYSSKSSWLNPVGPNNGINRVIRGGSWNTSPLDLRSTNRFGLSSFYSSSTIGFRCVSRTQP